ncbi:hypothetical protein [Nonomuraea dietziae]|uniref:Uncharacterized protein n=1 Tax=Nonomuraea dietziae TaxID=65515 RepID=A0A7W5YB67_9ACTN|nr:hypothetical protein [Nonomuraea dietziae]MBB3731061.1 hypothetical protein [Nonomuraea dietziae]
MDEQRQVTLGQHVEQPVVGLCGRGDLQPCEAAVEVGGQPGRVDVAVAGRRPRAERLGQLQRALVVGVDERPGLLGRQELDAQRAGEGDQRELQVRGVASVVVGGVDLVRRLAVQDQGPAVEVGRARPGAQRLDERRRPQVLMDIDAHGHTSLYFLPRIHVNPGTAM